MSAEETKSRPAPGAPAEQGRSDDGVAAAPGARRAPTDEARLDDRAFRALFDQSAMGVALIDSHTGRFLRVNRRYCDITGYSAAEMEALDFGAITHPDDLGADEAKMALLRAGAIRDFVLEKRYVRRDGTLVWVDLLVSPLWGPGETPTVHLAVVDDITERKATEESLRQHRELLRTTARIAKVGGWEFDTSTMRLVWSEETFRIHEIDDERFVPTVDDAIGFYVPEHVPLIRAAVEEAIRTGRPFDLELAITTRRGRRRDVRAKGEAEIRGGATVKVWGTFQDITERKQAEAALANAQRLESLGTLAGGIAHDYNNILTSILGNLALLEEAAGLDAGSRELVAEAKSACAVAKGLSTQLLTFAKGGSPVVEVLDVRRVLREAAQLATRGSSVRVELDLGAAPLAVSADKGQIAQVVQNLALNAVQAMPGGGSLRVRAALVELGEGERPPLPAGRYVRVTVSDSGVGIAASDQARIFDPYFSTKATGRGLGLSVCYSIMARHGGAIDVASTPGVGTDFTLHFPAVDAARIEASAATTAPGAGRHRVLVMDDDPGVTRVLSLMLQHLGHDVDAVPEGGAALAAYRAAMEAGRRYDLVIADLTVPGGMGGKEMMARLRAIDPTAVALVSSGYSRDAVVSDHRAYGFAGVLSKPYLLEELAATVHAALGDAGEARRDRA